MTEFEGVHSALAQALTKRGYEQLTPVQKAVLAPELRDADALVSAQTGSGKTVAFGMALAPTLLGEEERFTYSKFPLALAVAPTRELALQVKRELEWLYAETGARVASCVGGMDMQTERKVLNQGAHIVVGTPGRLRDHIERGSLNTSGMRAIVLDEADEMLDLGFRDDLEYILDAAPEDRRTLMFSATVGRSIAGLAKRYQRDAVRVTTTTDAKQHLDIDYRALTVAPNDRENAIINVLRFYEAKNAIVFCNTRATVNHMTARFNNRGFSVVALSGELSQNERTHALQAMRDGRARVCIATDVAARGIDLPNLELVIHADLPKNQEGLLHRSGRTGRAGRKGTSVLIVPHNWRSRTERLLNNAKIQASWAKPPTVDEIKARDDERLLADPVLSEPVQADEEAFIQTLLDKYSPEQIAAAFMRQSRAGRSAPEELLDAGPNDRPTANRHEGFKDSVWFTLSVGRDQSAEARWLLPMLCRAGHITKNEIGAIRIQAKETHVEIAKAGVDRFVEGVGTGGTMEKNVTVTRLDGSPPAHSGGYDKPRGKKSFEKKKPFKKSGFNSGGPKFADKPGKKSNKKFDKKSDGSGSESKPWEKSDRKPTHKSEDKPAYKSDSKPTHKPEKKSGESKPAKTGGAKSWSKSGKKNAGKKTYTPKFSKGGPKPQASEKGGDAPMKRKRPKKAD